MYNSITYDDDHILTHKKSSKINKVKFHSIFLNALYLYEYTKVILMQMHGFQPFKFVKTTVIKKGLPFGPSSDYVLLSF